MIIYDIILLILQYQVSTTVMDLVVVFALFVFMLALLCFCVATVFFPWIKIYIIGHIFCCALRCDLKWMSTVHGDFFSGRPISVGADCVSVVQSFRAHCMQYFHWMRGPRWIYTSHAGYERRIWMNDPVNGSHIRRWHMATGVSLAHARLAICPPPETSAPRLIITSIH